MGREPDVDDQDPLVGVKPAVAFAPLLKPPSLPAEFWKHHEAVHGHLLPARDDPAVLCERALPEEQHRLRTRAPVQRRQGRVGMGGDTLHLFQLRSNRISGFHCRLCVSDRPLSGTSFICSLTLEILRKGLGELEMSQIVC